MLPVSLEMPVFQDNDAGHYLDDSHGWRLSIRVVEFAMQHGFKIENTADRVRFESCQTLDGAAFLSDVIEQGGLSDQALEYLGTITDDGLYWELDGGLFLRQDEFEDE